MLKVVRLLVGSHASPPEVIFIMLAFMAFEDFLHFRHASPTFFQFTTKWEAAIVALFIKSCDMVTADRLFRTLLLQGPLTLDYLLQLRRRCTTAGNLANALTHHHLPQSNVNSFFEYTWVQSTIGGGPVPSPNASNAHKLKRCLLLHIHFFESLRAGLVNQFAVENQETQVGTDVSRFLQVEAETLSRYPPKAIDRVLGVHEWLFAVIVSRCGLLYEPLQTLFSANEKYIFEVLEVDPFLIGGHPALEDVFKFVPVYRLERLYSRLHQATATSTEAFRRYLPIPRQVLPPLELEIAKRISSVLPTGYVRNLGFAWPGVSRENAIAQLKEYLRSAEDNDDGILVPNTTANQPDANASTETSLRVPSECPPTSTTITQSLHRMTRPENPSALEGIGRR